MAGKNFLLFFCIFFAILSVSAVFAAEIWTTDILGNLKTDFSPYEDVFIRGAGFNINSAVQLEITRPDNSTENGLTISDYTGKFVYVYDLDGIKGEYSVYATDGVNEAETVFTDAAIWTTKDDCGDESQDVNHYNIGDDIYINGDSFSAGSYSWSIKGKPGGASCDPDVIVANGTKSVNSSGEFCFNAYTVQNDDCGEYQVKFNTKGDNYRVQGAECGNGELDAGEECDDGNNDDGDGCSADCMNETECNDNSDCSVDYYDADYCLNEDVYHDLNDFFCSTGLCERNIFPELKQDCGEDYCTNWSNVCMGNDVWKKQICYDKGCSSGSCFNNSFVNKTKIEECGEDSCNAPNFYCKNDDVWKNQTCYDRGCSQANCFSNPFVNDSFSKDCGVDYCDSWGDYYCEGKNKTRQRTCYDRGCSVGECFNSSHIEKESKYCGYGCSDRECNECEDKDFDCVCDKDDECSDSKPGEMINEEGCDPFQFCRQFYCGDSCYKADFIPVMQNCEEIQSEPETGFPGDCTTVMIHKEGIPEPRCTPLTCLN